MKKLMMVLTALVISSAFVFGQPTDSTKTTPKKAAPKKKSTANKVYYGGNIGLNFGDYFRLSITPYVGYKITPKLSGGVKVRYEYIKDKRYAETVSSHNYGGSLFARYRFIPQLYAHAEFAYLSYKYQTSSFSPEREWVPFLLLGGGYAQRVGSNVWAYVEVLFDVLQNDKSPFKKGEPFVSVGVGVGF